MSQISLLSDQADYVNKLPDATPEQEQAAVAYLRRTGNIDLAPMLGLGGDAA